MRNQVINHEWSPIGKDVKLLNDKSLRESNGSPLNDYLQDYDDVAELLKPKIREKSAGGKRDNYSRQRQRVHS